MMISRALSANIRKELNVEVDSAYTLADAKARLASNHDYFAALVDLTLPESDADKTMTRSGKERSNHDTGYLSNEIRQCI
jgi:hypothetical protein